MSTPGIKQAQPLSPTLVGMGKMGGNMARRLARNGFRVHGFDPAESARDALSTESGVVMHDSLQKAVQAQESPRVVWMMLPAGEVTNSTMLTLEKWLTQGDILVDGGNANYLESQQRHQYWRERQVQFVDCGVSGGVWGLDNGYCLMAGGETQAIDTLSPLFDALAVNQSDGWLHCGPGGAGHFTKMIHNGIEYGMMQAYAEGFALLAGRKDMSLDLAAIAELWRHGSVVRSWLLDLTAQTLSDPKEIERVGPVVSDSGEGRWTVDEAVRQGIPAPVIAAALMSRFDSQGSADTTNKLLSLMRRAFGGHATHQASSPADGKAK
jgi:6-phosphogluconate dehydrogenase